MGTTVEVRFKGNRKDYFLWPDENEPLRLHDPVIVEAERGLDFGRVGAKGAIAEAKCAAGCGGCPVGGEAPVPKRQVVRLASREDIQTANEARRTEDAVRLKAVERARHHGLEIKISDAEWQWDRKKLTFYFTAEKRVDFRTLVRDLASTFRTRIELRQIGARDEAARLGGVGRCGKEFCCSTWLRELNPVSLSLAKDQHLALNPAQISGGCGRLLCCLKYEHEFYVAARKRFPKEGKTLRTARGAEKVVAVDIFRERVLLRSEEHGPRQLLLADLRAELEAADPTPAATTPEPRPAERVEGTRPGRSPRAPRARAEPQPTPVPAATQPAAPARAPRPGRKRPRRRRRRGPGGPGGATPPSPEG